MFRLVEALRREGITQPWKVAFRCLRSRYWFHRTYLLSDRDGFKYDPSPLAWHFGKWKLWEDKAEIMRQKGTDAHT